jgi:hypothetical protein
VETRLANTKCKKATKSAAARMKPKNNI